MWKVIIADDEKLICRLVQALVDWNSLGMEIVGTAENGLEALELVKNLKPDIMITDIRMPGCDGLELIKQTRSLDPDIEIVIISGYAHFEYAQTAITYGVGNYILKPIKQNELVETLNKIMKRLENNRNSEESGHQNSLNDLKRLRESLLKDVLEGKRNLSEHELKDDYHFEIKEGSFQAFVLKIDFNPEIISQSAFSIIRQKVEELFRTAIPAACQESLFGILGFTGYGILNYQPENRDEVRRRLREFLKQLDANKKLFGDVEFSLGLGQTVNKPEELADSMETADLAVAERLMEGCSRMFDNIPLNSDIMKQSILEQYVRGIEHALEVLDEEEAFKATEGLKNAVMSVPHIRGREILEIVMDAGKLFVLRTGSMQTDKIQQNFEMRCRLSSQTDGLFEELNKLQAQMLLAIKNNVDNDTTRPIRIAKKYIMENYYKNITLEEICEAVGFSAAYFSVMFKKETGEGFSKYLTRVRIDKAKEFLRETNMPVSEICEKVGYSDRKHFTHTFHKMTGVTPVEFRRLYG